MITESDIFRFEQRVMRSTEVMIERGWPRNSLTDINGDLQAWSLRKFKATHGFPLICFAIERQLVCRDVSQAWVNPNDANAFAKMADAITNHFSKFTELNWNFVCGVECGFWKPELDNLSKLSKHYPNVWETSDFRLGVMSGKRIRSVIGR